MPLFILAILIAGMLVTAAITFTVCAAVPALRRFAITAPAASLVFSPVLLLIGAQSGILMHHAFIIESPDRFRIFLFGLLEIVAIAIAAFLALAFALFCRGVLEYVPPLLNRTMGFQPHLLLQFVLFIGALASAIVNFTLFATLMHTFQGKISLAILFGLLGVLSIGICLRPVFRLQNPQAYSPKPLPAWVKKILFERAA
jgi:hypothetical protein